MWMTRWKTLDPWSQERGSDSNVELYASEEEEESDKSSDEESILLKKANQMLFNGLAHCDKINVEQLSICHGPTRDLGENATAKDFFNVFINDAYIDEII